MHTPQHTVGRGVAVPLPPCWLTCVTLHKGVCALLVGWLVLSGTRTAADEVVLFLEVGRPQPCRLAPLLRARLGPEAQTMSPCNQNLKARGVLLL
jgi:hypothetical protein